MCNLYFIHIFSLLVFYLCHLSYNIGRSTIHRWCYQWNSLYWMLSQKICSKMFGLQNAYYDTRSRPTRSFSSGGIRPKFPCPVLQVWRLWTFAVFWGWGQRLLSFRWSCALQSLQYQTYSTFNTRHTIIKIKF